MSNIETKKDGEPEMRHAAGAWITSRGNPAGVYVPGSDEPTQPWYRSNMSDSVKFNPGKFDGRPRAEASQPEHIMQFFTYEHLPPHLAAVSKPFADLARALVGDENDLPGHVDVHFPLPNNPERAKALDKLLEAKDAAVRARVATG